MNGKPTDVLEEEHRLILQAVAVMTALADALEAGQAVEGQVFQDIVEFMRTYADKRHHGKEEDLLFPLLLARGIPPQGCPIGALRGEHEEGRALVRAFAGAAAAYGEDRAAARAVITALRALTQLYPSHIWKEDYLLFPMTNKVLGPEDQSALYEQFQAVDQKFGDSMADRYQQIAAGLAAKG
jgi:hemerythrin-like domain-containing protein